MNKKSSKIQITQFSDALSQRYLAYALSTITSRSLPDVRDGLKPVHRRLLFAMRELKLNPDSGFKKCARIVGDVMGKFHPHGDQAIYDAMVRLAQSFSVRYLLVDGQGNFGNVDGDNAAAMRYTEARMTEVAKALLQNIDEDCVDFRDTYDGETAEPIVLPAAFPNILANGASGIAVGMATNIPPHNVAEICDAAQYLIKSPNAGFDKLIDMVTGPDFPTGGVLCEDRETIKHAYETGRGSMRVRARWEIEKLKGGQWQIVISEIPYQVQKSKLIERIAELIISKKITMLDDIQDESAEDIRVVLTPKSRNVDPEILMESLFRQSDLENRFSMNMNVLDHGRVPKVMNLRQILQAFLNHRHDVLIRRKKYRKIQILHRLEILKGYIICFLNLDEVIKIIREADNAKKSLIKAFDLSEIQAEAILNMRLRSLRKLEEIELRKEHETLELELKDVDLLLNDEMLRWKVINSEIGEIKKKFGKNTIEGKRRTDIMPAPSAIIVPLEAMIEREAVTIVISKNGWIRALKGHISDISDVKYKEGDAPFYWVHGHTTDKLLIFCTNGRFYTLGCDKLPSGRGHGEPLRVMMDLGNEDKFVKFLISDPDKKLLVAASDGRGFIIAEKDIIAQTKNGKQILNVSGKSVAKICVEINGDMIAVIGENRRFSIFPLSDMPEMSRGRGVIIQKYLQGGISDLTIFDKKDGLCWKSGDRVRRVSNYDEWIVKRGHGGRMPPAGFPRSNKFK